MRRCPAAREFSQPDFALTGRDDRARWSRTDAHVRLVHPDHNGGAQMLRRGYNFVDGSTGLGRLDAGLFFIAYVTRPAHPLHPDPDQDRPRRRD